MEQEVIGKKWDRCYGIQIDNQYNSIPNIKFLQESILDIDNSTYTKELETKVINFDKNDESHVEFYRMVNEFYNKQKV